MSTNSLKLQAIYEQQGIHFDPRLFVGFGQDTMHVESLAMDSMMAMDALNANWNPNSNGTPPQFLIQYAPDVIEQLTLKRAYLEIGREMQIGDFSTEQQAVPVEGLVGYIADYDDYSSDGKSDNNYTFPMRDIYVGQTVIQYGERETAQLAKAKINAAANKQFSAAETIAIAQNKLFFFGNQNSAGAFLAQTYGLLNDPDLVPYTPVAAGATSGSVTWSGKQSQEIYTDINAAYAILQSQLGAKLTPKDRLLLCVSGVASSYLGATNSYGLATAWSLIKAQYPNIELVTAIEYGNNQGGSFQLIAIDKIRSGAVRDLFTYKFMAHMVSPQGSSFRQKFSFGSGGCLLSLPAAVASMSGIGS